MFFALKQVVRVALSSPSRSVRRGQHGLVSLALIGAILGEIVLCGLIITRIACEQPATLRRTSIQFRSSASLYEHTAITAAVLIAAFVSPILGMQSPLIASAQVMSSSHARLARAGCHTSFRKYSGILRITSWTRSTGAVLAL